MKVTIEREDCKLEIQGTEDEVLNVVRPVLFPCAVKAAADSVADKAVNEFFDETFEKMEICLHKRSVFNNRDDVEKRFDIIYNLLGLREQFVNRLDTWYSGYFKRTRFQDLYPKCSFVELAKDIEKGL